MKSHIYSLGLSFILTFASTGHAKDSGFRYTGGKCVNAAGQAGLNPGFIGQCGDLNNVTMSHFRLDDSDLQGSSFESADMQMTSFHGANLTGVNFKGANLSGVDMENAVMHEVDFTQATLVNIHVAGADISKVDFSGADLSGALLSYMKFADCKFERTAFSGAALDHVDLSGSNLTGVKFSGVNLQAAILDRANLTQANFESANLIGASLMGVNAGGSDFRGATLRNSKMDGGNFSSVNFKAALMDGVSLAKATLDKSDLRNAVLKGAKAMGATFAQATFNKRTVLPFSMADATSNRMILSKTGSLLIIDDKSPDTGVDALKAYLESEGGDVQVAVKKYFEFDGTESLGGYNAILQLNSAEFQKDMPAAGQAAIMAFVTSGGTYMATQWSGYMLNNLKLLQGLKDLILINYQSNSNLAHTLIPDPAQKSHPILDGISAPITITADWNFGDLTVFDKNPSVVLMADVDKKPMVIVREVGTGKSVNFAFAANYQGGAAKVLSQAPVQKLILNTLNW